MKRDNAAFKDRFQRWKNGELVYENGRVIPHYEGGSDGDVLYGGNLGTVVVKPDPILRLRLVKAFPDKDIRKGVLSQLYVWKLFAEMGKPMYHEEIGKRITPNNIEQLPSNHEVELLLKVVEDSNFPTASISTYPFSKTNITKKARYNTSTNSIEIPKGLKSKEIGMEYISELAHAYQYNTDLKNKGIIRLSFPFIKYDAYEDPNNIEYQAHQIIEPSIYLYVRSNDSSNLYNSIPHYEGGSDGFFDKIINTVHSAYNVNNNEQYAPEGLYRLYDVVKKDWELNNPNSLYTFERAMEIKRMMENVVPKNELIGPAPNISEYERNLNNLRGLAAAAYEQKLKDIQTGTQVLGALGTIARPSTWIAAPFRGVEHFGEGFGNELVDIPLDIVTAPAAKLAFKGIKSASKALTPVRNIPYNSENFYRSVGKEAIEDANTTGVVRANPISEYAGPNFLLGGVPLFTRGRNYVIEAPKGSALTWVDAKAYERDLGNYGKPTIAEASAENPIAYPMTNGELSIPTDQASYWKKYPILGWRLKLFKTPTLEQEVFPEGLLNDRPLIAGAVDNAGGINDIGRVATPLIDFENNYLTLKYWMENVPEKDFHEIIGQSKSFFENREKMEQFQKFFRSRLDKYLFDRSKVNISNSPEVMLERLKLSNLFDSDWYKKHVENLSDRDLFIKSQLDAIFNTPVFSYKIQKPGIGGYFEPNPFDYGTAYIDDNIKNGGLFYSKLRAGNIGHELGHGAGQFDYLHTNPPTKLNEESFLFTKPEYYGDYDETRTRFLNVAANELWEYRNPDYFFERTIDKIPNSNYTDILYGYDRDFSKNYMRTFKSIIPYLIGGATLNIPTITNDKR